MNESLLLLSEDNTVSQVASLRNLKETTIYSHLAEGISAGMVDPLVALSIDEKEYRLIAQTFSAFSGESTGRLKQVFEALDEKYHYGILRCVAATEAKCDEI